MYLLRLKDYNYIIKIKDILDVANLTLWSLIGLLIKDVNSFNITMRNLPL